MSLPEQGAGSHLTLMAVSGAIGSLFVRWQASHGVFWQAGDESILGTVFAAAFFVIWWLLGPRIKRWRNSR